VCLDNVNFMELKAKPFKQGVGIGNVFFSTSDPVELYKVLLEYAVNKGQVVLNEDYFKIKLKMIDENSVLCIESKITLVKEGLYAVEFKKQSGDYFLFSDVVKTAKEFFGGHVNATC